ncbi:hypothetical protein CSAL01_06154 [Colletotrichum salicis]|uniref:Uncharacterized protein n=1 Tax=Colletotrichum salicis TaxID=1209931 RepID=A0A135V3H9_9PEZI|nr:hypothetical protein CSAL01_06154 [Colletotrichum salicis]
MLPAANQSNAKGFGGGRPLEMCEMEKSLSLSLAAPPKTQIDRNLSPLPDQNELPICVSTARGSTNGRGGLFKSWTVPAGSNVVSPGAAWKAGKRDDSQARTVEAQTSSKFPAVARPGRDPLIAPAEIAQ